MYQRTKIATAAAAVPVTLTEAKAHLRVDFSTDDTLITTLINVATEYAEKRLGRALITQTWDMYFDDWDEALANDEDQDCIYIPFSPLQSITHIKYYDTDNVQQTFSSANYDVDIISEPGLVKLSATATIGWPSVYNRPNAIVVRFVAGYGAASTNVPETIRAAIKLLISHFYENREGVVTGQGIAAQIPIPKQIEDLFGNFSINHTF